MIHHALFGLSLAALAGAGMRAASLAAPQGLERALAAAAFAAGALVIEALVLGLVGLGGSPLALALAAGLTWLVSRLLLAPPACSGLDELVGWWSRLRSRERLLAGALAGLLLAWTGWLLRYPGFGYDSLLYHLSESVIWVQSGTPGSVEEVVSGLPVGSYPVAHEVITGWGMGLTHSFVPATLIVPFMTVLAAAGGWQCLRSLHVPRGVAGLAVGAVLALPSTVGHARTGASLDPAALAWLAACAALCAGASRRPALFVPALVAGGLAIGTKTTAVPLTALVLCLALYARRGALRPLRGPVLAGAAVAAVVGASWYVRNLIDHGSPFWPFLTLPGSDAQPASAREAAFSFLDRPGQTLERAGGFYLDQFVGAILLLAGALAAPLFVRGRAVLVAGAATLGSILLWLNAPLTGVADSPGFDPGTGDAVRYLLPGVGAAALTIALAARAGPRARVVSAGLLGAALVLGLLQTLDLGFPGSPSPATLLAGVALGAAAVWLLQRFRPPPLGLRLRLPKAAAAAAVLGALAAPFASGYLDRHARMSLFDSGLVGWFAARDGDTRAVAVTGAVHALTAGDRLQRRIELIPPGEGCRAVRQRLRREWVVLTLRGPRRTPVPPGACLAGESPAFADGSYLVFSPDER